MANIPLKTMSFEGLDNTYTIPESFNDLNGSLSVDKISGVLPVSKGGTGTNSVDSLKEVLDVPSIDSTLSISGDAADAKAVGDALKSIISPIDINIAEQPNAYLTYSKNRITDGNGWTYAQQGMTVTDKYIILVGTSVGAHPNEGAYVCILDKDSYTTVQPTSIENFAHESNPFFLYFDNSTTPKSCHANCAAWNSDENKIYIASGVGLAAVVLDAETFEQLPTNPNIKFSSFDYDNIRHEWAINKAIDGNYAIEIRGEDFELLTTVTGKADSSAQGFCYYDGVCYIPTTHGTGSAGSSYSDVYDGYNNVFVIDRNSNLLRNWLYPRAATGNELEDIAITDGGRMLMSVNNATEVKTKVYEARYMQSADMQSMTDDKQSYLLNSAGTMSDGGEGYEVITIVKDSNFTQGDIYHQWCYRSGNTVFVNLQLEITGSASGWRKLASGLPAPPRLFDVSSDGFTGIRGDEIKGCQIRVTSTGNLEIALGAAGTHYVSFSYPTAGMYNEAAVNVYNSKNTLAGLNVLAMGDSICRGGRNEGKGFIGDVGCNYINIGVGGACISTVHIPGGTDTAHPIGAETIPQQVVKYAEVYEDEGWLYPDAIITDGGRNDYLYKAELGDIPTTPINSDTEASELDLSTIAGGLQYMFYNMIKLFPKAKRYFLLTHRDTTLPWTRKEADLYTQTEMNEAIAEICKIYNVEVIDVFNESFLNSYFSQYVSDVSYSTDHSVTDTEYIDHDGVHPLALGYRTGYVPLVKRALLSALKA